MVVFPHCKINIGLDIVGRLPNGYHLLETVMIPAGWKDVLELTPATETQLTVTGRAVDCPAEKNLVMKAYTALADFTGGLPPTDIRLHKVIPDGAGLGGGSADAAFTLLALNDLYNLGFSKEILARIASEIGADCPFFIYSQPMLCTGTGTDLQPLELPEELGFFTVAIVKPPVGVSTAEAYRGVKIQQPARPLAQRVARAVEDWQGLVVNAFEDTVIPRCPRIGQAKAQLLSLGAVYASMSGSGSAVYGLFPHTDPEILADLIGRSLPDCQVNVFHCKNV